MIPYAQNTPFFPATDGAFRATNLLLNEAHSPVTCQGNFCCFTTATESGFIIGHDVNARRSCWRTPDCIDSDEGPRLSRIKGSIVPDSRQFARHLNPTLDSCTHAVVLLPTACACRICLGSTLELGGRQRERPIGTLTCRIGDTINIDHDSNESPSFARRRFEISEPFNGGTASDTSPWHNELDPDGTSRTLEHLHRPWSTMDQKNTAIEKKDMPVVASNRIVTVGGYAAKRPRKPRGTRPARGLPGKTRPGRPEGPARRKPEFDRVGVQFTGEKFVPSMFQWTEYTETKETLAPPRDDLPVVDVTGRPRMFQEEAIHGSVKVCSWSRMVRRLFGELPRDRANGAIRFLPGSRSCCAVWLNPTEPSRHQGFVDGFESDAVATSEPDSSARCLDGIASTPLLGVGVHSHPDDLGGIGAVDGAALFLQLGA